MGQNHTVVDLEKYRATKEGSSGSPEKEPRPMSVAAPELLQPHTYTEIQIPEVVRPFVTAHHENPVVSDEVRKLGVQTTDTTPIFKEPTVLTELGLTVQKVLALINGKRKPSESGAWLGHHAHRQLRKGGQDLDLKTGEVVAVQKKAA